MKILILFAILVILPIYTFSEDVMDNHLLLYNEYIEFEGNQQSKDAVVELLDRVLQEQGDFGVYGNFQGGIAAVLDEMSITIVDDGNGYWISVYPRTYEGGHDFSFSINKKTEQIADLVVGEVLPPPEFER